MDVLCPLSTTSTLGVKINTHYPNSHTKDKNQSWILQQQQKRGKGFSIVQVTDECNSEVHRMSDNNAIYSLHTVQLIVWPVSVGLPCGDLASEWLCKTGGQGGKPWVMSDEKRRGANQSQRVGHLEVRLPASLGSGKVQPHSIRQISETETGREKSELWTMRTWPARGGKEPEREVRMGVEDGGRSGAGDMSSHKLDC